MSPTLWAGASWLFFRVACSTRMTRIWALSSRLEKQPTDLRQNTSYFGDRTLVSCPRKSLIHLMPEVLIDSTNWRWNTKKRTSVGTATTTDAAMI
jgi:hypothetical protein